MTKLVAAAALAALFCVPALGQTTNVGCENDYYLGLPAGRYPAIGTPCNPAASVVVGFGTSLRFVVDTGYSFGSLVAPFVAVGPCTPKALCLPPIACGIPVAGAPCFSNQSWDLTGAWRMLVGTTGPGACQSRFVFSLVIPNNAAFAGIVFSTQSVILPLGVSCAVPSGFVVTEAFNFQI